MKVPKARKLSSGMWFIQLRLGGESIPVTAATEKKCIHEAELIKAEHLNGKRIQAVIGETLDEAITDYIKKRKNVLSPSTIRGYTKIQERPIIQDMAHPISPKTDWQSFINKAAETYSPKTVRNMWGLISSVLRSKGIVPPVVRLPQLPKNERPWLEPDQIKPFLAALKGQSVELPAILALHSLRRSEILALSKSDIDTKAGTISVHGSVVQGVDDKYVSKATNKNLSSARTVPIIIPRLVELVEAAPDGKLVTYFPGSIGRSINTVCKKANLPLVGVHGLRHSFASLAYHLGLSERQTMDIGGWSDSGTMRKIYTHLAQIDRAKAKNVLHGFFSENANKNANENQETL